jgi:5-methylthioadenosine/S-adenosylhomocysteine deaminase
MATIDGAKCLKMESKIGSLEVGKRADILLLDSEAFNLQPCIENRIISHLVYATNGSNVTDAIINGKLVYENRKLLH